MKDSKGNTKKIHLKDCSFTKKGKKYSYYALAESNKTEGKNQKSIIKYLGDLTPEQVESYRYALASINNGKGSLVDLEELSFEEKRNFLDVAVLHALWEQLGLSRAFESQSSRKEVQTCEIAEILTLSKLLKPSSNVGTIDWFKSSYLANLMGINPEKYNRMKIFNELGRIEEQKSSIEQQLFKISKEQNKDKFEIYFIDGTTTFFEGTHCALGASGKDKTNGYKTHMILIMLVTDHLGLPCAWDVYRGNEKEVSRFKDVAKRICDEYKIINVTYCFDRGFASIKNFHGIEGFLSHFISGIDQDQIAKVFDTVGFQITRDKIMDHAEKLSSINLLEKRDKKRLMPVDGFYTSDGERFYKELGIQGEYRHVVGFSTEIYHAQQESRNQAQQEVLLKIAELNDELSHAKKDRDLDIIAKKVDKIIEDLEMQNLIHYTLVPTSVKSKTTSIQSCSIQHSVDIEKWKKAGSLDGIFVYITDHTEITAHGSFQISAYDITRHYKDKYVIEQDFRDLKNVINLRPLYVRLPEHVRAVVGISVLAQFMNVYISRTVSKIGMSIREFFSLLEKSAPVAILKTPKRTVKKLIKTHPKLIEALELLGLKNSVFSSKTMAALN